jgi:hypothetical protein
MSPLDDELRTALSSRTASLTTGPDFLAGVERRAKRLRRQRVASTVAGSAMAVTALGLGGPLVASSLTGTADGPLDQATTTPAPTARSYVLDPENPWPYRGVPVDDLGTGTVEAVRVQLAAVRGVDVEDVALTPLYGQVDEPSQSAELLYLARVEGVPAWASPAAPSPGRRW